MEDEDWSFLCTEEGKAEVRDMFIHADANENGTLTWDEIVAFYEFAFEDHNEELDFFMRHNRVFRYLTVSDELVTESEWSSFFACKWGMEQPYAYLAFAWLQRAEEYAETGHITLPDEEVAYYLEDFAGMSEE